MRLHTHPTTQESQTTQSSKNSHPDPRLSDPVVVMGKDQSSRHTSLPERTGTDETSRDGMSRRSARPPEPPREVEPLLG